MAEEPKPPLVRHLHFKKATELLDALSPRSKFFAEYGGRMWVFRGHPDDAYQLVPSALRDNSKSLRDLISGQCNVNEEQALAEYIALSRFFYAADEIGLSLPEDTQVVRAFFSKNKGRVPKLWPPVHLLSLMAIAQHHGLPTRLLDWSRHPLKAAYFAGSGAVKHITNHSKNLCVWGLSLWNFELAADDAPVKIVTAPAFTNPNLRAQEGIFTVTAAIEPDRSLVDRRPLDILLLEERERFSSIDVSLYRFTLPSSEAISLLWHLEKEGVTHAKLFPDFYGVVNGMKESSNCSRIEMDGQDE